MPLNTPPTPADQHAQLVWDTNGQPVSRVFGDVYFSKTNGLAESRHVFLQHNQLAERFRALDADQHFIIGETGFGTGLNFLACWQLWQANAPAQAQLFFISVEKYPLHRDDLRQALALWPELVTFGEALLAVYPPLPAGGFVRLNFGRVNLTLILEEATAGFTQLTQQATAGAAIAAHLNRQQVHWGGGSWAVDAWFLDGFAPAKNPQMWSAELFFTLARLSKPGTTFATFTAAAVVKQGLANAGFSWQKVPGFGYKRHMLKGELRPLTAIIQPVRRPNASWHLADYHRSPTTRVAIIGGGLAGCHTARALAEKGVRVSLFERGQIAQGGSGNPQGVVYAKLSHQPEAFADFNLAALLFACSFYEKEKYFAHNGAQTGVMQLAFKPQLIQQYRAISETYARQTDFVRWCDAAQASEIAGVALHHGGLFFPRSGWLNPPAFCARLIDHPHIQVLEHTPVTQLTHLPSGWQLSHHGEATGHFSHVILACAEQARQFDQAAHLSAKPIRGQITQVAAHPLSSALQCVLCGQGYIAPASHNHHCLGASFNPKSADVAILSEDERENLRQAEDLSTAFKAFDVVANRASLRCGTPDYLPMVGPVAQAPEFIARFARYRQNLKAIIDTSAPYHPHLYANLGHGSRGLTYTPLCAELLAGVIVGLPLPVSREVFLQLHPARFLVRDLSRNKL